MHISEFIQLVGLIYIAPHLPKKASLVFGSLLLVLSIYMMLQKS